MIGEDISKKKLDDNNYKLPDWIRRMSITSILVSAFLLFHVVCDAMPAKPDISDGLVDQALAEEAIFEQLAELDGRERRAVDLDNEDTSSHVALDEIQKTTLIRNKREPGSVLDRAKDAVRDMKDGVSKAGKQASNIARGVMDSAQRSGKAAVKTMKDVASTGTDAANNMKKNAERTISKAMGG